MMRIYCPYCGTSYDIDESLMPEGNVKVRCRSCANVFVMGREKGAVKDEPEQEYEHEKVFRSENEPAPETKKYREDKDIIEVSEFMKQVIQEIDGSLNQENKENESNENEKPKNTSGNKKIKPVRIVMLLILILLLIAAGAYTLEYYNIINLPAFFPKLF